MTEIGTGCVIEGTYHIVKENTSRISAKAIAILSSVAGGIYTVTGNALSNKIVSDAGASAVLAGGSYLIGEQFGKIRFEHTPDGSYQETKGRLHSVVTTSVDIGILASAVSLVAGFASGNHAAVEGGQYGLLAFLPFRIGDITRTFDYRTEKGLVRTPDGFFTSLIDGLAHLTD